MLDQSVVVSGEGREAAFWNWISKNGLLVLLCIFAVNVALKLPYLSGASLFLDEAVAIHETQGSIARTVEFSASDPTPPLFYLVLGQWCKVFGISEASARFPSLLFSAITACMIFSIGRRFFSVQSGFYAAWLFTFSNTAINFSHEARAYALAGMLMSFSYYLFLRLASDKASLWRLALALTLVNAALLYTHYLTSMGIAAQALMSLWLLRGRLRAFAYYVGSQVLVLLVWLPWLMMNRARIPDSKVTSWLGPPDWLTLRFVYYGFAGPEWLPLLAGILLLVGGALVAWRYAMHKTPLADGFALSTFALWFLGATGLQILVSYYYMPVFELRYALYAFPGACLLLGAVVASLPGAAMIRNGLIALYIGMAIASLDINPAKSQDWRAATAKVKELQSKHTGMVINAYYQFTPFCYYYNLDYFKDYEHTMSLLGNDNIHLGKDTLIVPKIDGDKVTDVILVLSHEKLADPQGILLDYMARKYCLNYRLLLPGIKVLVYQNSPCELEGSGHFEWPYDVSMNELDIPKIIDDPQQPGNRITFVKPGTDYSASYNFQAKEAYDGQFNFVEIKFRANATTIGKHLQMVFVMEHGEESYNWGGYDLEPMLKPGTWADCSILVKVPEIKDPEDRIKIYFWSNAQSECYFDDLQIDIFD